MNGQQKVMKTLSSSAILLGGFASVACADTEVCYFQDCDPGSTLTGRVAIMNRVSGGQLTVFGKCSLENPATETNSEPYFGNNPPWGRPIAQMDCMHWSNTSAHPSQLVPLHTVSCLVNFSSECSRNYYYYYYKAKKK
jgi:hypothetical protein